MTAKDLLRAFVAEETRDGEPARIASTYLSRVEFCDKESWQAAATRVLQYHRAAEVEPNCPYHVEPKNYFCTLKQDKLVRLGQRTIGVLAGRYADTLSSHLDVLRIRSQQLYAIPISTGDMLGPTMVNRGLLVEEMYGDFVHSLCRRSNEYFTYTAKKKVSVQLPRGVAPLNRPSPASQGPTGRRDIYGIKHLLDTEESNKAQQTYE